MHPGYEKETMNASGTLPDDGSLILQVIPGRKFTAQEFTVDPAPAGCVVVSLTIDRGDDVGSVVFENDVGCPVNVFHPDPNRGFLRGLVKGESIPANRAFHAQFRGKPGDVVGFTLKGLMEKDTTDAPTADTP